MKLLNNINNLNRNPNSYLATTALIQTINFNKDNYDILKLIKLQGFIDKVEITKTNRLKEIRYTFNSLLSHQLKLVQISKPGRRVFISNKEVVSLNNTIKKRKKLNNSKIAIKERYDYIYIIRTSKGLITSEEAIKLNIGGELILKIKY